MLAVLAVSEVALDEHDLLARNMHIFYLDVPEHAASLGIRLLVVVGGTHTAAGHQVETRKVTILALDSNETDVVRIHVGVVVRRNGDCDLELSGQVSRAVEGLEILDSIAGDLGLLVILVGEPDLVVGSG